MTDRKVRLFLRNRSIEIAFTLVTLLFFTTLLSLAWVINDVRDNTNSRIVLEQENRKLAQENRNRIKDIQESRLKSCQTTYSGIREVFKPFFPPVPRTAEQQKDLDKFNSTINRLILRCETQTKPSP